MIIINLCPQKGNRKIWTDVDKTGVSGWKKIRKKVDGIVKNRHVVMVLILVIPSTSGGKESYEKWKRLLYL